jgi:hypothetical protein
MKAKILMTMAVAGTFGLSAAAFAENAHAGSPFSVNETGSVIDEMKSHHALSAHGSTSSEAIASVGSYGSGNSELSASSSDESLAAASDGIYSDYYIVSWTPATVEVWDVYLIDTGSSDELAASESMSFGMPTHELAVVSDDSGSLDLALIELPADEFHFALIEVPSSDVSYEMAAVPSSVSETAS